MWGVCGGHRVMFWEVKGSYIVCPHYLPPLTTTCETQIILNFSMFRFLGLERNNTIPTVVLVKQQSSMIWYGINYCPNSNV
jgi:hypothetical protein